MFDLPMKIDNQTISLAVYYLRRVIPAGQYEQDELLGVIKCLQQAGQNQHACSTDSTRSYSLAGNT